MGFKEKIEQLRNNPENIRLRWVWGLTIISMLVIIFVWFLTIKSEVSSKKDQLEENSLMPLQLDEQVQSIKETTGEFQDYLGETNQEGTRGSSQGRTQSSGFTEDLAD